MRAALIAIALLVAASHSHAQPQFAFPSWSPDGQWIAFAADLDGRWRLYASRPDGSDLKRLSRRHPIEHVAWSPAGNQIAFDCRCRRGREVFVLDVGSGEERRLDPEDGFEALSRPAWSPSGERLTYMARIADRERSGSAHGAVIVREMTLGGASWIINHPNPIAAADFLGEEQMLLTGTLDGEPQLWIYDDHSATMSQLVSTHGYRSGPARVDPQSTRIAFNRARLDSEDWEIAIFDLERSELHQITATAGQNLMPSWSPDGTRLAYHTTRNARLELMIMDIGTRTETNFSALIAARTSGSQTPAAR